MKPLTIYESLEDIPPECSVLFDIASRSSFFSTLDWYQNLVANALPSEYRIRAYVACADNEVKGMMLMQSAKLRGHIFKRRKLEALTNYYTSLFVPHLSSENDREAVWTLIEGISKEHWDVVDFHPLQADSSIYFNLSDALRNYGMLVQPYFCFGNWYLEVDGRSYGDYFETLPSKLKNTLKRKTKQLETSFKARIDIVTRVDEVEHAVAAYEKVYAASWKNQEPHPEFVPGLIRFSARNGWLRLGLLFVEDEPVAAQLWIVKDGIAAIYKLAYDEKYSKISAGSILTARLMKHVIDVDRVREVDYLTGDDEYKKDWMSHRRERWGIVAFNRWTLRGLVEGAAHLGYQQLKKWRSGLGKNQAE
jgi:hypothetical protein